MGFTVKQTLDRVRSFKNDFRNLIDNTMRFHWTHERYLVYRQEILTSKRYREMPTWGKEHIRGYECALIEQLERNTVFSYVIDENGTRAPIDSEAYRKVAPMVIHEHYSHTGAFVWRDAPDKFWTMPKTEKGWLDGNYYCECGEIIGKNLNGDTPYALVHEHLAACNIARKRHTPINTFC